MVWLKFLLGLQLERMLLHIQIFLHTLDSLYMLVTGSKARKSSSCKERIQRQKLVKDRLEGDL